MYSNLEIIRNNYISLWLLIQHHLQLKTSQLCTKMYDLGMLSELELCFAMLLANCIVSAFDIPQSSMTERGLKYHNH